MPEPNTASGASQIGAPLFGFKGSGFTNPSSQGLPAISCTRRAVLSYLGFPLLMLGIVGSGAVRAFGTTGQTELVFAGAGITVTGLSCTATARPFLSGFLARVG